FSPDGHRLAVGTDAAFSLVDRRIGRAIGPPITATLGGTQPFGSGGEIVASVSTAGGPGSGVAVLDPAPPSWAGIACQIAGRDLTPQEWSTYLPDGGPYEPTCSGH